MYKYKDKIMQPEILKDILISMFGLDEEVFTKKEAVVLGTIYHLRHGGLATNLQQSKLFLNTLVLIGQKHLSIEYKKPNQFKLINFNKAEVDAARKRIGFIKVKDLKQKQEATKTKELPKLTEVPTLRTKLKQLITEAEIQNNDFTLKELCIIAVVRDILKEIVPINHLGVLKEGSEIYFTINNLIKEPWVIKLKSTDTDTMYLLLRDGSIFNQNNGTRIYFNKLDELYNVEVQKQIQVVVSNFIKKEKSLL